MIEDKTEDEPDVAPKPKRLPFTLLKESDYFVRRYTAMIPVTHTLKDVEDPEYFLNNIETLVAASRRGPVVVQVMSDDYSIHAEYLVLEATRGGTRLRLMTVYSDAEAPVEKQPQQPKQHLSDKPRFEEKHGGRAGGWRIFENGVVVAEGIKSRQAVVEYTGRLNRGEMKLPDIPEDFRPD